MILDWNRSSKIFDKKWIPDDVGFVNAAEVIEEIKRLPLSERGKVIDFLKDHAEKPATFADDIEVEAAAEAVFEEHSALFNKLAQ